jgi:glutamyl-Q tRNA(Asp) synthetase
MIPGPCVTRFAPSPTGLMHLGHAFSAVTGWAAARATGGKWLLRIEDIDSTRCRPEFVDSIHQDLAWLGLSPDMEPIVQTSRRARHDALLATLEARGLLYACVCTRADIARAASAPHAGETVPYPGTCRGRTAPAAGPHAWRLDLAATGVPRIVRWTDLAAGPQAGDAALGGDPVLVRKDGAIAYHLACIADDADSGVTLVTRGEDLAQATPVQRLLQQLLAFPEPRYLHHRLLTDADGARLAKRSNAPPLAARRTAGDDGAALRRQLLRQSAPLLAVAGLPISDDAQFPAPC